MAESLRERRWQIRQAVIAHDSYAVVARAEGVSREYIRQLVGNGLTSWAKGKQKGTCIDCKQVYKAVMRGDHDGRCSRCRGFLSRHGIRWSKEAQASIRQWTHCKRGHPLTPDNVYIIRNRKKGESYRRCRQCAREQVNAWNQTPEGKAIIKKRNAAAYAKLKADPVAYQKLLTRQREYARRRRANNRRNQS